MWMHIQSEKPLNVSVAQLAGSDEATAAHEAASAQQIVRSNVAGGIS
jgi:hypothetical protein